MPYSLPPLARKDRRLRLIKLLLSGLTVEEAATAMGVSAEDARKALIAPAAHALVLSHVIMEASAQMQGLPDDDPYKAQAERTKLLKLMADAAKALSAYDKGTDAGSLLPTGYSFLGDEGEEEQGELYAHETDTE